jgi:hypothetical protein
MTTSRDYKFIVGSVLSLLGFLTCINPWFLIFGVPVLIIGLILIWMSDAKNLTKVLLTIAPVILWYPGMGALYYIYSEKSRSTPETFLVPEDFRGEITIIYDEPCGITVPEENGRLVYRIPDNGILIITNPFEPGIIDHEYYWIDKNGQITGQIPGFGKRKFNDDSLLTKNPNEPLRNKVRVIIGGTGSRNSLENEQYQFAFSYVNARDSSWVRMEDKRYSMVDSVLEVCRNKGK